LISLNDDLDTLLQRTSVSTITSQYTATPRTVLAQAHSQSDGNDWQDGRQIALLTGRGDGTVPIESSQILGVAYHDVAADHAGLPSSAASLIVQELYPNLYSRVSKSSLYMGIFSSMFRYLGNILSDFTMFFDCPVQIKIKLPEGTWLDNNHQAERSVYGDLTTLGESGNVNLEAEILANDQFTLATLPRLTGEYEISVTATADTQIRAYFEHGEPAVFNLKNGASQTLHRTITSRLLNRSAR